MFMLRAIGAERFGGIALACLMKITRLAASLLLPTLLAGTGLVCPGCAARKATAPSAGDAAVTPTTATARGRLAAAPQATGAIIQPAQFNSPVTAPDLPASEIWNFIKDDTYDQRADFTSGFERISARIGNAMQLLAARRTTLPETSIHDWDFEMKELMAARADLRFQLSELNKATPETWSEAKDRVGQAWARVRDDFDKVRSSTTI